MRLFISLPLSEEMLDELIHVQTSFHRFGDMHCPTRENLHLTLKFLGETKLEDIQNALQHVSFKQFSLTLSHLGSFEVPWHGKTVSTVLWATFQESSDLLMLKKQIDTALPHYKDDYPFQAHVTLARIATLRDKQGFSDLLAKTKLPPLKTTVQKFHLMRSTLLPSGRTYTALESFPAKHASSE